MNFVKWYVMCLLRILLLPNTNLNALLLLQLRNVFGAQRHAPHATFAKISKVHNGKSLGFIKVSECRMGGTILQLLRVYRLKPALEEAINTKAFLSLLQFQWMSKLVKNEKYWDLHYAIIQCLYPLYRLLRLADMRDSSIEKVFYYMLQVDRLMQTGVENVCSIVDGDGGEEVVNRLSDVMLRRSAKEKKSNKMKKGKSEDDYKPGVQEESSSEEEDEYPDEGLSCFYVFYCVYLHLTYLIFRF